MLKPICRLILLSLLVVLFGLRGSAAPGRAQAPAVDKPAKPIFDRGPEVQVPINPYYQNALPEQKPFAPSSQWDWSRKVFQSLRDDNWEIYYISGIVGPVNLTLSPASDVRPRLSKDGSRIIFDSNRSGATDIYAMNTDGSGLTRLTTHPFQDYAPAWSPDGRRIAFVSNRDKANKDLPGEIYIMNADGSGQTRLTYSTLGNDDPSFSPDGKQIAWVIFNGLYGQIAVMNADGSNPHTITGPELYMEHPVWSPSGTRIACDYDADGDDWNDIVIMNPDGSGAQIVYNPSTPNQDAWMGAWFTNEDLNNLLITEANYILYQNQYYLYSTYGDVLFLSSQTTSRFTGSGYDMFPDYVSLDPYPPVSQVNPLPAFSRAAGFGLNWSGHDVGVSGLAYYSVQYRIGSLGNWQDLFPGYTNGTSSHFSGSSGKTVYFRSRAVDNADNWEHWPSGDGSAWTNLFTWKLGDKVTDNRGRPLSGASVNVNPAPWETAVKTDPAGNFVVHLIQKGLHFLGINHPGYQSLEIFKDITADTFKNVYLAPEDNQLQNGGFESGLTGWSLSGTLSTTIIGPPIGPFALRMSYNCELPCLSGEEINFPGIQYPYVSSAVDSQGNLHVVFDHVKYSMRDAQGAWTPVYAFGDYGSPLVLEDNKPVLKVDSLDTVHVVFVGADGLYYLQKTKGGSWSIPVKFGAGVLPALAVDDQGTAYISYQRNDQNYIIARRSSSGSWKDIYLRSSNIGRCASDLTIGPDGHIHAVFVDGGSIQYEEHLPDGTNQSYYYFGDIQNSLEKLGQIKILVDSQNRAHILTPTIEYAGSRVYTFRDKQGVWMNPVILYPGRLDVADMALDQQDGVHILGVASGDLNHLHYFYRPANLESFESSTVYTPSPTSGNLSMVLDQSGALSVTRSGSTKLVFQNTALASTSADVSISQPVTLTATLHQPTLAFMYRLTGAKEWIESGLQVSISSEVTGTQTFSATAPAEEWSQFWVDLTPWSGNPVTVTLGLHQAAGEPYIHLDLDSASAGSWLTPVPLQISPSRLEQNWASALITITGDNFIDTPIVRLGDQTLNGVQLIDEHTLRATLPPDLGPGAYPIMVINPGGQEGYLSPGFIAGHLIFLPVLQR